MGILERVKSRKDPEEGDRVYVYHNFHRDCLSVCNMDNLVCCHKKAVVLTDVEFKVSEAGRQRVLDRGVKNVHAKVHGKWSEDPPRPEGRQITYNPYKYETFVYIDTEEPVYEAETIAIIGSKVYEQD